VIAAKPDLAQVELLRVKLFMDIGRYDAALKSLDQVHCQTAEFGRGLVRPQQCVVQRCALRRGFIGRRARACLKA
jgi:hypothetical protein